MITLHLFLIVLTLLLVVYSDISAAPWLLRKKETLSKAHVRTVHLLVTYGLALIILTGGIMFVQRSEALLANTLFLKKMFFVLALVINGYLIGTISKLATEKSFSALTKSEKAQVIVAAAVSTSCWIGAVVFGFLL